MGLFNVDKSFVNITGTPLTRKYIFLNVSEIKSLRKKRIVNSLRVLFFFKGFFFIKKLEE
jgi:hypothetical protein